MEYIKVKAIIGFSLFVTGILLTNLRLEKQLSAQTNTTIPTVPPTVFNQAESIAKLNEQIKGKENEPVEKVFRNIQILKGTPAGRFLRAMETVYSRHLGVNCTHCHIPEKWEADEKSSKEIARDMVTMIRRINSEILPGIKRLRSKNPRVSCATCHRGEITPALVLSAPTPRNNK